MINHKVSARYASSLLESSLEKKSLDSVYSEVEFVHKVITENPQLSRILPNPVIKTDLKISIISEIFGSKISSELLDFIKFVIGKGREDQLLNILEKFMELRDEHLGIVNIFVQSAFEFTPEQKEKLQKRFEEHLNKKVRIKLVIDKNIIGGFVANVNDTVYDASVKHQLELLKKEFLSGGVSLN